MKDSKTDLLNGEKGNSTGYSDHLASRKKNGFKTLKSMDTEFHANSLDDNIDNESGGNRNILSDRPSKEESAKKAESTEIQIVDSDSDFDSDEDTFADAESDCEPNHLFLNEMLEDYHPERLNLFDYRKKEQEKNKGGSSSTLSSSDTQNDEDVIEDSSTSRHDENDEDESDHHRIIRNLNINDESESTTEQSDGNNDSFGNLPMISKNGGRRLSMGASPGVGPGRAMLRQASRKAVWGK